MPSSSTRHFAEYVPKSVVRQLALTAAVTASAVLSSTRMSLRTLSASVSETATIVRGFFVTVAAGISASGYWQFPPILGSVGGPTLSLTKFAAFNKVLTASVSSTSSLARRAARALSAVSSTSATVTSRAPVSLTLTVAASVLSRPLMWFRRALRISPATVTSLSTSPAQTTQLNISPDEYA